MLIDTHCHIYFDDYDEDREEVIQRSLDSGIESFLNIGIDLESSKKSIETSRQYPHTFATVGLHPHEASTWKPDNEESYLELFKDDKVVAIGEVGLDYYRNLSPKEKQHEVFRYFINLQKSLNLPVVIHAREAFPDIFRIIREELGGKIKGVLHCFSGNEKDLEEGLELGLHISFAGPVTYKKNETLRNCARIAPLDRIVVETDSPYLSPQSKRGKRNEPTNMVETAELIAKERGMVFDDFARATTENAKNLFQLQGKI